MKFIPYLTSIASLISLFVIGPALGRAMFPKGGPLTQAAGKMVAIVGLLFLYGLVWTANPNLIGWYTLLHEVVIAGSISVQP